MLKLAKRFNYKQVGLILLSFILIIFQVWLELKIPDYMSEITVLVKTTGSKMSDILLQGGYMLVCAFGSLLSAVVVGYITSYLSASFSLDLRKDIFTNVESFCMKEIKMFSTSSLITRTTNDITNIEMIISMGLQLAIKAPITAVWAVCKILNKSWQWSAITGGAVIILLTLVVILLITVYPNFKIVQKLIDSINEITRENLKGIRVVRAFNAEKYQEDKFEGSNKKLTDVQTFNQKMMGLMSPVMYLIMNGLTLAIYFVGAFLIEGASLGDKLTLFSNMVVFSSYAMQVIMSFLMLAMIFIMLPRASISANRIAEVLDTKSDIEDGTVTKSPKVEGLVEFNPVSFKYPDSEEYVLKDINFKAMKGQTIAFIGSTGSGKSTLINLIPRFYDATEGAILVDNINVKDYTLKALHNKLGYISQKAVMFTGTVKSNVSYGDNGKGAADDKMIADAIDVAQAKEFVDELDKGVDSHIAEGGTNVSGGQKQRLSIARAIARNPEIYLFDDSFSALDYKTDYMLRKALRKHTKDATCLIVAQRIGTIKNADLIIVLDDGNLVGMGTHKELLKNCKVYQEIAYSQLSKEELEDGE